MAVFEKIRADDPIANLFCTVSKTWENVWSNRWKKEEEMKPLDIDAVVDAFLATDIKAGSDTERKVINLLDHHQEKFFLSEMFKYAMIDNIIERSKRDPEILNKAMQNTLFSNFIKTPAYSLVLGHRTTISKMFKHTPDENSPLFKKLEKAANDKGHVPHRKLNS